MGLNHNQKNYIIGFPSIAHAKKVQKIVGAHTKSYIYDYEMETFKMQRLHISKKMNINDLKCSLYTLELQEILTYPFMNNIGIVFALEMLDDGRNEFVFDCEYFDPFYNTDVFRQSLENKM
uniref:Uncharacterized protein n=1 Tax=viral metagenome TaxID=1070528 RepID=A0A6C0CTM2_9ZZZZ